MAEVAREWPAGNGTTMGLLAGMGVRSTAPFLEMVIDECRRQYGAASEPDFPRMIVFSWPLPFTSEGSMDGDAVRATILEGLVRLAGTGVDFVAMPCNTAHVWFEELARAVAVPVLDMVEEAVAAVPPATRRVALLATRATRDSRLYHRRLEERGLGVVAPDGIQERIDRLLGAIRRQDDPRGTAAEWRGILEAAAGEGADVALVACTDLNAVPGGVDGDAPVSLVDGTRALAARVVRRWMEEEGRA